MQGIETILKVGQARNTKDLHETSQDIDKSLLVGDNAIKAGMVISMENGRVVKYNGVPFAMVTDNINQIGLNYSEEGNQQVTIAVSKKGVRLALTSSNEIFTGDLLTIDDKGLFVSTDDINVAVATAAAPMWEYEGVKLVSVDFNFSTPKSTKASPSNPPSGETFSNKLIPSFDLIIKILKVVLTKLGMAKELEELEAEINSKNNKEKTKKENNSNKEEEKIKA